MNFDLHIQNIGKLTDAKIRIGRFTVFAGANNTGKSFVSKILYSLFNAMNANHAEVQASVLTAPFFENLEELLILGGASDITKSPSPFMDEVEALNDIAMNISIGNLGELENVIPKLAEKASKLRSMFSDVRSSHELMVREGANHNNDESLFEQKMDAVEKSLAFLENGIKNTDAIKFITDGMEYKIKENLIQNFQIPNLSDLRGEEKVPSRVDIKNLGTFEFLNGDIEFSVEHALVSQLQRFSSVVYVESPAYWKLKSALEDLRIRPMAVSRKRERLSGVPRYFYDLASALRSQYTGEMAFQNVYARLTGKEVLGGKIVISDTGAFLFQENGRSFTMPVTAMGVANLGVLALLIECKVLDQETFIFIDEPEAHLHPAWQVVMAETLFALAKGGAHVAIATHSVDILKWLEVHVKKHSEDESLIALNKFPVNGCEVDNRDFEYRIAAIKQELTRPFADLYVAGL